MPTRDLTAELYLDQFAAWLLAVAAVLTACTLIAGLVASFVL